MYFTNVKNQDDTLLEWDINFSTDTGNENRIAFQHCDKKQTVRTYLQLVLINDRVLTTNHDREVIVE